MQKNLQEIQCQPVEENLDASLSLTAILQHALFVSGAWIPSRKVLHGMAGEKASYCQALVILVWTYHAKELAAQDVVLLLGPSPATPSKELLHHSGREGLEGLHWVPNMLHFLPKSTELAILLRC
jgi:hypothetical protein